MKRMAVVVSCLCSVLLLAGGEAKAQSDKSGKAVLEAYVAAWNRHDFAAFDSLLAPDGIHEDLAQDFRGQGAAQVKEFMRSVIKEEPDFQWRLTRVIESGPTVAAEWTWTATHTGDSPMGPVVGKRISGRGASFALIEDGRIKHFTDYYDNASFFPKAPAASSGDMR